MFKTLFLAIGFCLAIGVGAAAAQSCPNPNNLPYPLCDGATAYGSQVLADVATRAPAANPAFSGYVGIGTNAPQSPLSVSGQVVIGAPYRGDASLHITTAYGCCGRLTQLSPAGASQPALNLMASTDGGGNANWWAWGVNNNKFTINSGTGFGSSFVINSGGAVGIGTANPAAPLDVVGAMRLEGPGYMAFADASSNVALFQLNGDGNFVFYNTDANGNWYPGWYQYTRTNNSTFVIPGSYAIVSDERLKKNVRPVSSALAIIQNLRPVRYNWRSKSERTVGQKFALGENQGQIGFVAQELQQVVPEAVNAPINNDDVYTVRPDVLIPLLVKAIQEQQADINALKAQVAALKGR